MQISDDVVIGPLDVASAAAQRLLRDYFTDVVGRFYGRPPTDAEVDAVMADETNERLTAEHGTFLVAQRGDELLGCIGLRALGDCAGEIKRMFVRSSARGLGIGAALLAAAEVKASVRGWNEIKLDTASGLTEARALYASRGYVEIPPYNANPYAQHWFAKTL